MWSIFHNVGAFLIQVSKELQFLATSLGLNFNRLLNRTSYNTLHLISFSLFCHIWWYFSDIFEIISFLTLSEK